MASKIDSKLIPPEPSQYLKVDRSTKRYRLLLLLAEECDCRWQEVARVAIDTYLARNPPKRKV